MRERSLSAMSLAVLGVGLYGALVLVLVVSVWRMTQGHFTYALDDPYIHLALAENLAHGHYGINPTEFSSPSSSAIWPLLLIPLAGTRFHVYLPLMLNMIFGMGAAGLIGWCVGRWPPQADERGRMTWWKQLLTVVLLLLIANLASLTLIGMEHVLQVMLAVCCAYGVMEALSGRAVPGWCVVAAVIAPAVRYEDLSLTMMVCLALAGQRRWKIAFATIGLSVVPLIGFSIYLKSLGLPALPMSVLVKGNVYGHEGRVRVLLHGLYANLDAGLMKPERVAITVFLMIFASLCWQATTRVRRFVFGGAAALAFLQLFVGRFGWFHRYEVYALIFLTLLCLWVLAERPRFYFGYFALGLVLVASRYVDGTNQTRYASLQIYEQQYQMHRFVTEFYAGNYAVNDLGLVSFERRPGAYVLDLYGLASVEAARHPAPKPEWLSMMVTRYNTPLVMIYSTWFQAPASWKPEAKMCLPTAPIVVAGACVVFYSTEAAEDGTIREELQRFARTVPPGVKVSFDPPVDPNPGVERPPE